LIVLVERLATERFNKFGNMFVCFGQQGRIASVLHTKIRFKQTGFDNRPVELAVAEIIETAVIY
jgi:hypothetical protein